MRLPAVLATAAVTAATAAGLASLTGPADARIIERDHFTETFDYRPLRLRRPAHWPRTPAPSTSPTAPTCAAPPRSRTTWRTPAAPRSPPTWTPAAPSPRSSPAPATTTPSSTTATAPSPSPSTTPASLRVYDQFGKFVLHDAGSFRFSFDLDYHGTPGDPSDDTEVPDSFRIVREPTGQDDTSDRDFCADVLEFTTP